MTSEPSRQELEAQIAALKEQNAKLRVQLEGQYEELISCAETIQKVYLPNIKNAADITAAAPAGSVSASSETELTNVTQMMDEQREAILSAKLSPAEEAAQLRALEDRVRVWAKKFLHKIKAAASAAEELAGTAASANGAAPRGSLSAANGGAHVAARAGMAAAAPAPKAPRVPGGRAGQYVLDKAEGTADVLGARVGGRQSIGGRPSIGDAFGASPTYSNAYSRTAAPNSDPEQNSTEKKKKKGLFNRLFKKK